MFIYCIKVLIDSPIKFGTPDHDYTIQVSVTAKLHSLVPENTAPAMFQHDVAQ